MSRLRRLLTEPVPIHRWTAHVIFACLVWPVLIIACTAYSLKRMPYYSVTWPQAFQASALGTLIRLPDLIVSGAIFFGLSAFIFRRLGAAPGSGRMSSVRLFTEPIVAFVTACFGIALWYPSLLSQPLFLPLDFLPIVWYLLLLVGIVLLGALVTGGRGKRLRLAGALLLVGLLTPAPLWIRTMVERAFGAAPTALLLGIDSLSHHDDLSPIASWVKGNGGTWYDRAVTPGLFTNAVWTSVLTEQPIRTHHVYHTFLKMRAADAVLLADAKREGYRTIGMFSDQLTSAQGSTAGFDVDRSGPMGWRQLLLPMVANSAVLVPVISSALPRPWPGAVPSNESGTFSYDLRREVRSLLSAGKDGQKTFVAAHLTYVHLPVYPSTFEMSLDEFESVLRTPAIVVRDRTIDWQDKDRPDDPVPLNLWKVRRVQRVIEEEVTNSGFVKNGGKLVVFSDHGSRVSLSYETFGDPRYHHVMLATFGLPPSCPTEPISLLDIGRLMGFSKVHAEPSLEFAFPDAGKWPVFFETVKLRWSGQVDVDESLLSEVFAGLQKFDPYPNATRCTQ
jgi:hypothetical protein